MVRTNFETIFSIIDRGLLIKRDVSISGVKIDRGIILPIGTRFGGIDISLFNGCDLNIDDSTYPITVKGIFAK